MKRDFRIKTQPLVMIIPMIDIMLFLLIFFMLSTIYMVQTNNFEINLPQTTTEQVQEKKSANSITVLANGEILFEDEKISRQQLAEKVREILSDDTIFILYGDKLTRYEQIVNVLEILKKSGVKNISIATELKN